MAESINGSDLRYALRIAEQETHEECLSTAERRLVQAVQCNVRASHTARGRDYQAHPLFRYFDLTREVMDQ